MNTALIARETPFVLEAEGFTVSKMCERGEGANSLMRWEYEGKTGWGEDQDSWKVEQFSAMLQILRETR